MYKDINWLDIVFIIIIVYSGISAYYKGFILSFFRLISLILTIVITNKIYPYFSMFLREKTGIYTLLKDKIFSNFDFSNIITSGEASLHAQVEGINSLNLPDILTKALIENNNYEMYSILKVNDVREYIAGYLANISLNIISMIIVFVVVSIVLKVIINVFNLISKLPILNAVNKMLGLLFGAFKGVLFIWLLCILITFVYTNPAFVSIKEAMDTSKVAVHFYNNNLLMNALLKIFI